MRIHATHEFAAAGKKIWNVSHFECPDFEEAQIEQAHLGEAKSIKRLFLYVKHLPSHVLLTILLIPIIPTCRED